MPLCTSQWEGLLLSCTLRGGKDLKGATENVDILNIQKSVNYSYDSPKNRIVVYITYIDFLHHQQSNNLSMLYAKEVNTISYVNRL